MNFIQNQYILDNLELLLEGFLIGLVCAFILTPIVGKIAKYIGAVDLPASMRKFGDSASSSRINKEPKLKLGGMAIFISFVIGLLLTNSTGNLNPGVIVGLVIIMFIAFMDDKFEVSGRTQLLFQFFAAIAVVLGGISVTKVSFLDIPIGFDWLTYAIDIFEFTYTFVFPADILTVIWIVGVINIINWVGGVDDLNTSFSAIIATTMILLALDSANIALAVILAIYVGALIGYFPYNYYPSKIIQGATGDLLNGYLLAVFAIIGGTKWTATFIIFALPIIDALLVVIVRLKTYPDILKNPLKLLSISDKNHLHHRLLAVGYSYKVVLLIEVAMMTAIAAIAVYFSGIRRDVVAFGISLSLIVIILAIIAFLKRIKTKRIMPLGLEVEEPKEAVINVLYEEPKDDKEDKEEKFIY